MRNKNPVMIVGAATLLVLVSVDSPASEAMGRLVQIEGTAMISQGDRYLPGSEGTFLKEGDRLFALEGSEALLLFADACQYRLGDDQVLDVGTQSPCTLGLGGEYRPGLLAAVTDAADQQADVLREAQSQIGRSSVVSPGPPTGGSPEQRVGARIGVAGAPPTAGPGAGLGALGAGTTAGAGSIVTTTTLVAVGLGVAGLAGLIAVIDNNTGGDDGPNIPLSQ